MRLFVALDIPDLVRNRIQGFVEGVSAFAPSARWIRPESLHVTLKFIGEQSDSSLGKINSELSNVKGQPLNIVFQGCGFYPNANRPRIFWLGVEAGPELASLAISIDESLAKIGIPKETHLYSPHLTLARCGSGAPHLKQDGPRSGRPRTKSEGRFDKLQQKLQALAPPEFGTMTAHEFFLYESRTSASGAVYTKLANFELR
jgi:2'-5' RNA ligase